MAAAAGTNARRVVLGLLFLTLAGAAIYQLLRRDPQRVAMPRDMSVVVICLQCRAETPVAVALSQDEPYACPQCMAHSAYRWLYCYDCKHRFIGELVADPETGLHVKRPGPPVCPSCGGGNTGGYNAHSATQKPVADLLPGVEP